LRCVQIKLGGRESPLGVWEVCKCALQ
jgi:hypothetical protein